MSDLSSLEESAGDDRVRTSSVMAIATTRERRLAVDLVVVVLFSSISGFWLNIEGISSSAATLEGEGLVQRLSMASASRCFISGGRGSLRTVKRFFSFFKCGAFLDAFDRNSVLGD